MRTVDFDYLRSLGLSRKAILLSWKLACELASCTCLTTEIAWRIARGFLVAFALGYRVTQAYDLVVDEHIVVCTPLMEDQK